MQQHALRTAVTLYQSGTLDIETAARQAGVPAERLQRAVDRVGGPTAALDVESGRVSVGAD
jgi:predicted HTH domain antitoxin